MSKMILVDEKTVKQALEAINMSAGEERQIALHRAGEAMRRALEQHPADEPVSEIYRRQLEVIAVGDSKNPVSDAAKCLIETGFWDESANRPQPAELSSGSTSPKGPSI